MLNVATDYPRRHLISVEEYHQMGEAGILPPDVRMELIEGEIIEMAPIGSRHAGIVNRLTQTLVQALSGKAIVAVQNPVVLSNISEPQPDLAVLHFRDDYYTNAHPLAQDALLVIEVSTSTLHYDRETKLPLYARAGIPEVWIFDVAGKYLEIHRHPDDGRYTVQDRVTELNHLEIELLPGLGICCSDIFEM